MTNFVNLRFKQVDQPHCGAAGRKVERIFYCLARLARLELATF